MTETGVIQPISYQFEEMLWWASQPTMENMWMRVLDEGGESGFGRRDRCRVRARIDSSSFVEYASTVLDGISVAYRYGASVFCN